MGPPQYPFNPGSGDGVLGGEKRLNNRYRKFHLWFHLLTSSDTLTFFSMASFLYHLLFGDRTAPFPFREIMGRPGCVLSSTRSHHVPGSASFLMWRTFSGPRRKKRYKLIAQEGWKCVSSNLMHSSTMARQSIIHPITIIQQPSIPLCSPGPPPFIQLK